MTCSTCHKKFLVLFTCEDNQDRCYQCKTGRGPIPTALPMVPAPTFKTTPGPKDGVPYKSPYAQRAQEPIDQKECDKQIRVKLTQIEQEIEKKIHALKQVAWQSDPVVLNKIRAFEACVQIVRSHRGDKS